MLYAVAMEKIKNIVLSHYQLHTTEKGYITSTNNGVFFHFKYRFEKQIS